MLGKALSVLAIAGTIASASANAASVTVYVTEAPFAAVTDAGGHAEFHDIPEGVYRAVVWHPQLRVGKQPPPEIVTVRGNTAKLAFSVPITAGGMPGMRHM